MSNIIDALGKEKPVDMDEFRNRLKMAQLIARTEGSKMADMLELALYAAELGYAYGKEEA